MSESLDEKGWHERGPDGLMNLITDAEKTGPSFFSWPFSVLERSDLTSATERFFGRNTTVNLSMNRPEL